MNRSYRLYIILAGFWILTGLILARLFHWQIVLGNSLATAANAQRELIKEVEPIRGNILASDGFPLAINQEGFLLYANPKKLNINPLAASEMLAPIIAPTIDDVPVATDSSKKELEILGKDLLEKTKERILRQLSNKDLVWALLAPQIDKEKKAKIDTLGIEGLGYESKSVRTYPEASMAAHLLGFLGKDEEAKYVGYFGLEGYYDLELTGRKGLIKQEKDAINRPIPIGRFTDQKKQDGRNLHLYLNRDLQFVVEKALKKSIEKYEAKSGTVVIMDPKTGGILAMASYPDFNPARYYKSDPQFYINPVISQSYEPGSTFKLITVGGALNEGLITPDTRCDSCAGPYKIDKYYIRTWNNQYYKNTTMTDGLAHSDNTAMVFIAKKMGLEKFTHYLDVFRIGERTGIDLQGEIATPLRKDWKEVDLLTASFGQGLVVTPIEIVQAVGAIANKGKMMKPAMVEKFSDDKGEYPINPVELKQVIAPETAETLTQMMIAAVKYGDAKWAVPKGYTIAGKTGTAQIVTETGYDEKKTIASFVGFAPANDPKFVMLTIIREPKVSSWGSETAAPLFFDIAKRLFMIMGIQKEG